MIEVFTIPRCGKNKTSLRITIPVAIARKYKLKIGGLLGLEDTGDGIKLTPVNKRSANKLLKANAQAKAKTNTKKVKGSIPSAAACCTGVGSACTTNAGAAVSITSGSKQ